MEKPHIKLEIVTTVESTEKVFFKVRNNKRNGVFNNGHDYFNASNKIKICSIAYPEWNGNSMILYVLGTLQQLDEMVLAVSSDEFERIQQAVDEYNKKFELPEFIFRVSLDNIGTAIEDTLNELKQDTSWKEVVYDNFKLFAKGVLPAGSDYNIEYIHVYDKMLFTEVEYNDSIGHSKGMIHISACIGDDDWTIYYNGRNKYKL